MQERRAAIRISRRCRTQYCSSEDLVPRDGKMTSLSEQGIGLLVQEAHRAGELLSVGFSLPGEREALTATGVVRWSGPPRDGRWHPVGLNWLQLEESVRNRLQQFLDGAAAETAPPPAAAKRRRSLAVPAAAALLALGAVLIGWWTLSVRRENRQLQGAVELRDQVIDELGTQGTQLVAELGEARAHLMETAAEVARLDQQAQAFGTAMERMDGELAAFQASYAAVREERDALIKQVLDLEQARTSMLKRFSSVDELRLAIREAIDARKQARQAVWFSRLAARRTAFDQQLADGNRGYLIRDGQPTLGAGGAMSIRVHEPEPLP
ncbi:MAG: PilZ domain-containing protein [Candidatus Omnitrophica bacterium]|nr:PilZ domain-containing protein [Candidatus Omnitrophota bacterium]